MGRYMGDLLEEQMHQLVSFAWEQYGQLLPFFMFADVMLGLFEDVPGLECLSDTETDQLLHHLWIIYHDQSQYQANHPGNRALH